MECRLCLENFDYFLHQPVMLPCGHTLCKQCFKIVIETPQPVCPFDRKKLSKTSKFCLNYAIYDLLESPVVQNRSQRDSHSITCPLNHPLQQQDSGDFQTCSFCLNPCKKNLNFCEICLFFLCEDCSADEKSSKSFNFRPIHCLKNHELKHYSRSSYFYSRKNKKTNRIRCNFCRVSYIGASWMCRLCRFDLCLICVDRLEKNQEMRCENSHFLDPVFQNTKFLCSICSLAKESFLECKLCSFFICEQCCDYYNRVELCDEECPNRHRLGCSEDQALLYTSLKKEDKRKCSSCKELITYRKHVHCRKCKFNLCDKCFYCLKQGKDRGVKVKCVMEHELKYFPECRFGNICDLCRGRFRSGSFQCDECKFSMCIKCAGDNLNDI